MDLTLKEKFLRLWKKYFGSVDLPITFYYSHNLQKTRLVEPGSLPRCLIGALVPVRQGQSLAFSASSIGCPGGKRYAGFSRELRPGFEYFLSTGLPGKIEGERYKKSPRLVREIIKNWPEFEAPDPYLIFKRWDRLEAEDEPEVVIFFSEPDVLAGLFTLANFDEAHPEAVRAPMGSGCSSIITYPYLEKSSERPRSILGLFDPSARPYVGQNELSFAVPMKKFRRMIDNMEESFLITPTWRKIKKRIKEGQTQKC